VSNHQHGTPRATMAILGVSPIPNHRMKSGTSPRNGNVRSICTVASSMSSPARERPEITPSVTPSVAPMTRPRTALPRETATL
jgi:hypothetical protein